MTLVSILSLLFSVLMPAKQWYAPAEPIVFTIQSESAVQLVLMDFQGSQISTDVPTIVQPGARVDVRTMFPSLKVGTFILYAVPEGKTVAEFVGTPVVISMRGDPRPGLTDTLAVTRIHPLSVARITTAAGTMTAAFYYDFAPNTVANFIDLSRGGFYDGLKFHRVVPDFIVQAGDPIGDSSGGPGYQIEAEFNSRQHRRGTLSMSRETDPLEGQGARPRPDFANTAGSQFFIALNYEKTQRLNDRYTAFGRVVEGDDVLTTIATGEIEDAAAGRPVQPVTIEKIEIVPVTPGKNPYPTLVTQSQTGDLESPQAAGAEGR